MRIGIRDCITLQKGARFALAVVRIPAKQKVLTRIGTKFGPGLDPELSTLRGIRLLALYFYLLEGAPALSIS